MKPAIFLDRDGVLIENRDAYVRTWADVEFFPFTFDAMRRAAALPHAFFIVSNQAGVGKGVIPHDVAADINARVAGEVVAQGGRITQSYFCPHRPDEACDCRKPQPGMLLRAAREFEIDLAASWMIGDNLTDMQAGRAAGARCILVRTGLGAAQLAKAAAGSGATFGTAADPAWFTIVDNLERALEHIRVSLEQH